MFRSNNRTLIRCLQAKITQVNKTPDKQSRDPLTFLEEADKIDSALRVYKLTPDKDAMLISKFLNKGSPLDKIPTLIYKK